MALRTRRWIQCRQLRIAAQDARSEWASTGRAMGISPHDFPSLTRGELPCDAYDKYCDLARPPIIQFEHAMLLATALAHGEEISFEACPKCKVQ